MYELEKIADDSVSFRAFYNDFIVLQKLKFNNIKSEGKWFNYLYDLPLEQQCEGCQLFMLNNIEPFYNHFTYEEYDKFSNKLLRKCEHIQEKNGSYKEFVNDRLENEVITSGNSFIEKNYDVGYLKRVQKFKMIKKNTYIPTILFMNKSSDTIFYNVNYFYYSSPNSDFPSYLYDREKELSIYTNFNKEIRNVEHILKDSILPVYKHLKYSHRVSDS